MSFAELKEETERMRAYWALAGERRLWTSELALDMMRKHLTAFRIHEERAVHEPIALRMHLSLLPDFWRANQDPSRVDGRVLIKGIFRDDVQIQIAGGPSFVMGGQALLEAIITGKVLEAQ